MKKTVLAITILSMSIGLIGCGSKAEPNKEQPSDNSNIEQTQPQVSEEAANEISIDEARAIALTQANLTSDKVTFIRAETDIDKGVKKYDIEFAYDNKEYDYEIGATDGKVISANVEDNTVQQQQQAKQQTQQQTQQPQQQKSQQQQIQQKTQQPKATQKSKNEITVNEAKQIALRHANLTGDKVSYIKAELDVDDGVRKYEIDFTYNHKEYDYEINASTGSVISYEID